MRGITPVIATVLLLLITISIIGFAYLFLGRTTETATRAGSEQLQQQTQQFGSVPRIESVSKNVVYVRSVGSAPITNPTFFVAGRKVDASGPASLAPGEIGVYVLNASQIADLPQRTQVKVSTAGFSDAVIAAIKELAALIFTAPVTITGLVTGQEDGIVFQNSTGSTVAIITGSGNVGIGTTGPYANLDVVGSNAKSATGWWLADIRDTTSATAGVGGGLQFTGYKTGTSNIGIFAAIDGQKESVTAGEEKGKLSLWTNDGIQLQKRLTIDSSGNVGIGTTSPGQQLQVGNGSTGGIIRLKGYSASGNTYGDIGCGGDNCWFDNSYAAGTELFIQYNGNVGIGTTGPLTHLHVAKGSTLPSGGVGSFVITDGSSTSKRLYMGVDTSGTQYGWIQSEDVGVVERALVLQPNGGNVGIGTTVPGEKLTIAGVTQYDLGMKLTGNTSIGVGLALENTEASGRKFALFSTGSANAPGVGKFAIRDETGGAYRVVIDNTGNVGIGTTGPSSTLHVRKVSGASFTNGDQLRIDGGGSGNRAELHFTDAVTSDAYISFKPSATATSRYLSIGAGSNADNELVVRGDGNVGIGTTNPAFKLHIDGGDVRIKNFVTGKPTLDLQYASSEGIKLYASSGGCGTDLQIAERFGRYLCMSTY